MAGLDRLGFLDLVLLRRRRRQAVRYHFPNMYDDMQYFGVLYSYTSSGIEARCQQDCRRRWFTMVYNWCKWLCKRSRWVAEKRNRKAERGTRRDYVCI
jgi:hypothetical protein